MFYSVYKITKKVKREIAREVKQYMGTKDYVEIAIMYNPYTDKFFTSKTINIQHLEYDGYIHYKTFIYYRVDGRVTLGEIEDKIFGYY